MGLRCCVVRAREHLDVREILPQRTMIFANKDLAIGKVRFKYILSRMYATG
jgi:hypothetical protein